MYFPTLALPRSGFKGRPVCGTLSFPVRTGRAWHGAKFRRLKELTDHVLEHLDHQYLNEIEPFTALNPTAENIARYIYDEISKDSPVQRVNVFETETSVASS